MKKFMMGLFVVASAFTSVSHAIGADASTDTVYDAVNSAPPTGRCVGTEGLARGCVDTDKVFINYVPVYKDCVYTGTNRCSNITVSAPNLRTDGAVTVQCFGNDCGP